jgi:hypothetical protein
MRKKPERIVLSRSGPHTCRYRTQEANKAHTYACLMHLPQGDAHVSRSGRGEIDKGGAASECWMDGELVQCIAIISMHE